MMITENDKPKLFELNFGWLESFRQMVKEKKDLAVPFNVFFFFYQITGGLALYQKKRRFGEKHT